MSNGYLENDFFCCLYELHVLWMYVFHWAHKTSDLCLSADFLPIYFNWHFKLLVFLALKISSPKGDGFQHFSHFVQKMFIFFYHSIKNFKDWQVTCLHCYILNRVQLFWLWTREDGWIWRAVSNSSSPSIYLRVQTPEASGPSCTTSHSTSSSRDSLCCLLWPTAFSFVFRYVWFLVYHCA